MVATNARFKMPKGPFRENDIESMFKKLFHYSSEKYKITLCELSTRYFFHNCKVN